MYLSMCVLCTYSGQNGHWWGLRPMWILRCLKRLLGSGNTLPQDGQRTPSFFSPIFPAIDKVSVAE